MTDEILLALGDGWLGKIVVGILCGAGAWFARRPVEKAAVMGMVNQRVDTLFNHHEHWIKHLTDAHANCEETCARLEGEIEQIRGELRLAKQTLDSIGRVQQ